MAEKSLLPIDCLLESTGFMSCKLKLFDYIRERQLEIGVHIKRIKKEIDEIKSPLTRQEKIIALANFVGERDGLDRLWLRISVLQFSKPSQRRSIS